MAAATILQDLNEVCPQPGKDSVRLEVSDGETYVSKRLKTIRGALATGNSDVDADLNVTFSGQTATVNWAGQTDKVLTLELFGDM